MEVCFTLLSATDIDEFGGFDRFRVRIRSMESFEIKISTYKVQRLSEGSFSINKEKLKFSFDESDVICFDDIICFEFQVMNEENTTQVLISSSTTNEMRNDQYIYHLISSTTNEMRNDQYIYHLISSSTNQ